MCKMWKCRPSSLFPLNDPVEDINFDLSIFQVTTKAINDAAEKAGADFPTDDEEITEWM